MFAQTHQSDFTSAESFHVTTSNTKDPGDQVMPSFFSLIRHFHNFCQWPHKLWVGGLMFSDFYLLIKIKLNIEKQLGQVEDVSSSTFSCEIDSTRQQQPEQMNSLFFLPRFSFRIYLSCCFNNPAERMTSITACCFHNAVQWNNQGHRSIVSIITWLWHCLTYYLKANPSVWRQDLPCPASHSGRTENDLMVCLQSWTNRKKKDAADWEPLSSIPTEAKQLAPSGVANFSFLLFYCFDFHS